MTTDPYDANLLCQLMELCCIPANRTAIMHCDITDYVTTPNSIPFGTSTHDPRTKLSVSLQLVGTRLNNVLH